MRKIVSVLMSQTQKLPIIRAAQHSWSFAMAAFWPTLPAYGLKAVVFGFAMASAIGTAPDDASLAGFAFLIWLVLSVACLAMALRLALNGSYRGVLGLTLSPDEFRLGVAQLLYTIVLGFAAIVFGFLVWMIALMVIASSIENLEVIAEDQQALQEAVFAAFQTPFGSVIAVLALAGFALPILFLMARLVTFQAATIARQKIMLFETWSWSKGMTFQVILALVLAIGPVWALGRLVEIFILTSYGLPVFGWTAEQLQGLSRMQLFLWGGGMAMVSMIIQLVSVGLSVFMYRGFDPDLPPGQSHPG